MGEDLTPPASGEAPLTPPEEMKAEVSLHFGDKVALRATAWTTPAGIASVGIALSAILLAGGYLIWSCRRKS